MLYELERRPTGDNVLTGLEEWPLAQACWAAPRCKKVHCVSPMYDEVSSNKGIKDVLDSLRYRVPRYCRRRSTPNRDSCEPRPLEVVPRRHIR
jgi:hypothetical protein